MNILYCGAIDLQSEKGDTLHFVHLAQALAVRGHRLTMLAFGEPGLRPPAAVTLFAIRPIRLRKIGVLFTDIRFLAAMVRVSRGVRFDVLYQRGVPWANQWARLNRLPAVSEVNGIQVDELAAAGMRASSLHFYRQRERLIVRGAQRVICVTAGIRTQLVQRYRVESQRCVVIANAANTERFQPLSKAECRQALGLQEGCFHVGFVGEFQPWIDFEALLRALQTLRGQGLPVVCTLVGAGLRYEEVVQKVQRLGLSDAVHLVGWQAHTAVPRWIGAWDVCIAPFTAGRNQAIGLSPLKIYEYMACERPVVASDLPGITETFQQAQANLLYPIGDSQALARQLATLYTDPALGQEMGRRSRAYVLRHHSWANVAEQTEVILQRLV
jgi:glycosyltransferase involved in cell wall biosynthesis